MISDMKLTLRIYDKIVMYLKDPYEAWNIAQDIMDSEEMKEVFEAIPKPNPFYKSQMSGDCWICKRPRSICSC